MFLYWGNKLHLASKNSKIAVAVNDSHPVLRKWLYGWKIYISTDSKSSSPYAMAYKHSSLKNNEQSTKNTWIPKTKQRREYEGFCDAWWRQLKGIRKEGEGHTESIVRKVRKVDCQMLSNRKRRKNNNTCNWGQNVGKMERMVSLMSKHSSKEVRNVPVMCILLKFALFGWIEINW